jgi:hypothetical protein
MRPHLPFVVHLWSISSNQIFDQWVSSTLIHRRKKYIHTNLLILQILLNQRAVAGILIHNCWPHCSCTITAEKNAE